MGNGLEYGARFVALRIETRQDSAGAIILSSGPDNRLGC